MNTDFFDWDVWDGTANPPVFVNFGVHVNANFGGEGGRVRCTAPG